MMWSNKHSYYLGLIMGELYNNKRYAMEQEEEEVYDRVIQLIGVIAEKEVYGINPEDWLQQPEVEEDLH
jgi:hypothetical protein